jgi:chromosomal replication initiation ATPase DnaA
MKQHDTNSNPMFSNYNRNYNQRPKRRRTMKITIEQTKEIIDILKFHSTLLGIDKQKCLELISVMNGDSTISDPRIEIDDIIRKVSQATGVSVADIMKRSRKRPIVMARSFAIFQIFENVYLKCPNMTWSDIGHVFNMDHASIIQAHRRINEWLNSGDRLTNLINDRWLEVCSQTEINEAA